MGRKGGEGGDNSHSEPFTEVRVERKRKKHGVLYHVINYLKP